MIFHSAVAIRWKSILPFAFSRLFLPRLLFKKKIEEEEDNQGSAWRWRLPMIFHLYKHFSLFLIAIEGRLRLFAENNLCVLPSLPMMMAGWAEDKIDKALEREGNDFAFRDRRMWGRWDIYWQTFYFYLSLISIACVCGLNQVKWEIML
jgi:hypothetical protein